MHIKSLALTAAFLLAFLFPAKPCFPIGKPVVYFGIGLRSHPITIYNRYQPMMDYLTRNTPYQFELKISRDYKEIIQSLVGGKTAISAVGDGGLMKAMLLHGAVPIVKPLNADGKAVYRSCIVVPSKSPLQSLSELKGKRIAFGSKHSTTGNLVPRHMLHQAGVRTDELGSAENLGNHDAVARAVVKGKYDAGAVKSTVAERFMKHGMRVLASSEELPSAALIVRKDAPKELVQAVTDALVRLDRHNPEHRKIMENWDLEYKNGFVPATAADYGELKRMFKAIPYGCGTGCHL